MGGGNAQKTAASRAKHMEKEAGERKGGGGKAGIVARAGGVGPERDKAIEAARLEREAVKKKREEKAAKK